MKNCIEDNILEMCNNFVSGWARKSFLDRGMVRPKPLEQWLLKLDVYNYLLFENVDFYGIIQRTLFSRSGVGSRNLNFLTIFSNAWILLQVVCGHPLKNNDLGFWKSL